jgi:hypothetical protein
MLQLKLTFAVMAAFAVSGCMTKTKMNAIMEGWTGHTANDLIASWGPPTSTMSDGNGGQIFIYDQSRAITMPGTATTSTTANGNANGTYQGYGNYGTARVNSVGTATSTTIYNPPVTIPINRKRLFWVSQDGKIYRWSWQGL